MFTAQDAGGFYNVIYLAWVLSWVLHDVLVACTHDRGRKNGKFNLSIIGLKIAGLLGCVYGMGLCGWRLTMVKQGSFCFR